MPLLQEKSARIYRFGGCVAIHTERGPTVYLSPGMADEMGAAMVKCVRDIEKKPKFSESQFSTVDLTDLG